MKNIHAFTETTTTTPGYISISEEEGKLTVSVRTRGGQVPSTIEMDRDQLADLCANVGAYLQAVQSIVAPVALEPDPAFAAPVTVDAKPDKNKA